MRAPGRGLRAWVLLCAWLALGAAPPATASMESPCSECHTMHYSQNGSTLAEWGDAGPYGALLTTDCIGCHTGSNSGGNTPFIFASQPPNYGATGTEAATDTLAGGSFYWVSQSGGDPLGHNVAGLSAADASLPAPPGFTGSRAAADGSVPGGGAWPEGQQVGCAGTYGCHGTHASDVPQIAVTGGHHKGASGAITAPGTTAQEGYRMLVGIAGFEDPSWEYRPTPANHNQYKGADGGPGADISTISALCGRCHDSYHGEAGTGSPWLRHPTDYDMGNTAPDSEFRGYGGAGVNAYQTAVPVGSLDVSAPLSTVSFADDAIVTCVSCHRAHGSPYYGAMRWDYAGSIGTGCGVCHTSKN